MQRAMTASTNLTFARPTTPAAVCMHLIRLRQPITRAALVEYTGKSQPTITRAINALINVHLVRQRPDLMISDGPGRPTIPVELAKTPWIHIGIAVGTNSTYIGAYNIRGQVLREQFVELKPAQMHSSDFLNVLVPYVYKIAEAMDLPIANVGMSVSGTVTHDGIVTAPNLGWERVDIASQLSTRFDRPISVASVIMAIAGAEQQIHAPGNTDKMLVFYVDDTSGAAILSPEGVSLIDVTASESSKALGTIAVALVNETMPCTVILSGAAFAVAGAARSVGRAIRTSKNKDVEIRVIPTHLDNARSAARAVALDQFINDPLGFTKITPATMEN